MTKDINYYKNKIRKMKRSHKNGELRPNKVILMLAVCERISEMSQRGYRGVRMLTERKIIDLHPRLEALYFDIWNRNIPIDSSQSPDHFYRTFGAMNEESFWKLHLLIDGVEQNSYTENNLKENYEGAILDSELVDLLLEEEPRKEIHEVLMSMLPNRSKEGTCNTPEVENNTIENHSGQQAFIDYLKEKGLSELSVKKYAIQAANNKDVLDIVYRETGASSLFDVESADQVSKIFRLVKNSKFNEDGHNMYSVAIHHYLEYLQLKISVPKETERLSSEPIPSSDTPERKEEPVNIPTSGDSDIDEFYRLLRAVDKSENRERKHWSEDEDWLITLAYYLWFSPWQISSCILRSENAIKSRWNQLGLVDYDYQTDRLVDKEDRGEKRERVLFNSLTPLEKGHKLHDMTEGRSMLIDNTGLVMYRTYGSLQFFHGKYYRFHRTNACLSVNEVKEVDGKWTKGEQVYKVFANSSLYRDLQSVPVIKDETIQDFVHLPNSNEYRVCVEDTWYDKDGNITWDL